MIEETFLSDYAKKLVALGYDQQTAEEYAGWIGDCIGIDDDGNWVVEDDDGNVLATVPPLDKD